MTEAELELAKIAGKELAEPARNLISPICQAMGQTFADFWNIVFGYPLSFVSEVTKAKLQSIQDDFLLKLKTETDKIPNDKKISEPDLAILLPALEALKTSIADECARDMFAKLISNSMNSDYVNFVNKSFVEIIKQMSKLDAVILKTFVTMRRQPITKFIQYTDKQSIQFHTLQDLVYLPDIPESNNINKNAVSITNLKRLGLLEYEISEVGEYLQPESLYHKHDFLLKTVFNAHDENRPEKMVKGTVNITPLGIDFIKSCIL